MPDVTDIRARLAEAIGLHQYVGPGRCNRCDWVGGDRYDHDLHRADVLLSLPGIAIVELPERNAKGEWPCGCDGRHVWLDHSGLYVRTLGETFVHNPRGFAAALLAADNAAMSEPRPLGGLEGER